MDKIIDGLKKFGQLPLALRLLLVAVIAPLLGGFLLWEFAAMLRAISPDSGPDWLIRFHEQGPKLLAALIPLVAVGAAIPAFLSTILGMQQESKDYARKITRRGGSFALPDSEVEGSASANQLRQMIRELREEIFALKDAPPEADTSTPEKLFQVGRQRLLDEAVRLDSISRRNLTIGILFSVIALAVLAWPLIVASQQAVASQDFNVVMWASQYYLPRFAVGLLLQFVGFFFLRLYVANEFDLKHNKNEITNLEMKMIGVQLAQIIGDTTSKKEVIKSLAATERNFLIKKSEKTISTEAVSEYNDMKGLLEKIVSKLPGKEK